MNQPPRLPLIAVDVGNARAKFGWFDAEADDALPKPQSVLQIDHGAGGFDGVAAWLDSLGAERAAWWIGSVNRSAAARLVDWLRAHRPDDRVTLLAAADLLPLRVELPQPQRVGVDRLLGAVAVNRLRTPGRPAVVVDVGTAITVDFLSAGGAFRGGAILPGIAMSARALHEFTDLLPLVDTSQHTTPPAPVGASTEAAIASGLIWGTVGAIRELIRQMATLCEQRAEPEPDVFLTGGAAPTVAALLGPSVRHLPELTLAGIALTARE